MLICQGFWYENHCYNSPVLLSGFLSHWLHYLDWKLKLASGWERALLPLAGLALWFLECWPFSGQAHLRLFFGGPEPLAFSFVIGTSPHTDSTTRAGKVGTCGCLGRLVIWSSGQINNIRLFQLILAKTFIQLEFEGKAEYWSVYIEYIDLCLHHPEKSTGWAKLLFTLETAGIFAKGPAWELGFEPLVSDHLLISSRKWTWSLENTCYLTFWPIVFQFSSVQLLSHVWLFAIPWTAARQASLSITNSWGLLKLMSIELVLPPNHLILCHPLLLLPSVFPSIRVFSNESALQIRWPKYWSFSFSISPSNEYSGLISFRMDRLDLLAVQGTLKSLLQHHSSKASILQSSAFFMVQFSHP